MCLNGFMITLQISNSTETNKQKDNCVQSHCKPSHCCFTALQFVLCQALKLWALLTNLHTQVFLPTLVGSWSRWWVLHPGFWKNLLIFLYFPPQALQRKNHHFCLLFNQHLVKSGCKIKLPQFRIQYCNPKDIRTKLEHSVFGGCFFPLNGQNCFSSKITVYPDYNDKSSWLTLSEMSLMFSALFFHVRSHFYIATTLNLSFKRGGASCLQTLFLLCISHLNNVKHILYTERDGHSEGKVRPTARNPAIAVCFVKPLYSALFHTILFHFKQNLSVFPSWTMPE